MPVRQLAPLQHVVAHAEDVLGVDRRLCMACTTTHERSRTWAPPMPHTTCRSHMSDHCRIAYIYISLSYHWRYTYARIYRSRAEDVWRGRRFLKGACGGIAVLRCGAVRHGGAIGLADTVRG